jgi:hypothetical protein
MNNLAHTYNTLGRMNKAISLMSDVVLGAQRLGEGHPLTNSSRSILAKWREQFYNETIS